MKQIGAEILIHGKMTPILMDRCENITVKNLVIDYAAPTMTEFTVTEINGQKLASTQGVVNEVKDAFLHVNTVKEAVALNDVVTYKAYSKDLLPNQLLK